MSSTERVVIAGSSGLIGSELARSLQEDGIEVVRMVRRPAHGRGEVSWDPDRGSLDPSVLQGARAVVNLCGASIGKLPWTEQYRTLLRDSRFRPTRTLADALRGLSERGEEVPQLVNASAVGYYGNRPGERLTEEDGPGATFLARLCVEWEREALAAGPAAGVALLRTAPVIDPDGVLKPLMLLTRFGLGGPLGSGRQMWPWISLADEVRAIRHVIEHRIEGPVNLAGPIPASAGDTGRELAKQMHRPYLVPAPAPAVRFAVGGDAADSLLFSDALVVPAVLERSNFRFTQPTIQHAIAAALDA